VSKVIFQDDFAGNALDRQTFFGRTYTGDAMFARYSSNITTTQPQWFLDGAGAAYISNTALSGYTIVGVLPMSKSRENDVEIVVSTLGGNDDPVGPMSRVLDQNNYYAGGVYASGANPDQRLVKCVGGVVTSLGTANIDEAAPVTIKLETRDATKRLYTSGVQRISSADNSILAVGEQGIAFGDLFGQAGDDASNSIRVDSISVTDEEGTVSLTVGGDMSFSENTPAQITSNQNDYSLSDAIVHRLSTDAARTITGFAAPTAERKIVVINVGSFNLQINHQDGSSAAANRIIMESGANLTLQPNQAACFWYDSTTARWREYA
jgi:hypothetical protein